MFQFKVEQMHCSLIVSHKECLLTANVQKITEHRTGNFFFTNMHDCMLVVLHMKLKKRVIRLYERGVREEDSGTRRKLYAPAYINLCEKPVKN